MSKKKYSRNDQRTDIVSSRGELKSWSRKKRLTISILLLLHISAVFTAPWSGPPPASELSGLIARLFEPYLVTAFLNHGYRFFAPNPGPSHLVRYEILKNDDSIIQGKFPDLKKHRPRLLYHRYLMLSETVYNLSIIPEYTSEEFSTKAKHFEAAAQQLRSAGDLERAGQLMQEAEEMKRIDLQSFTGARRDFYQQALKQKQLLLSAIAQDLLLKHDGEKIKLFLVEHAIPDPGDILQGMKLTDRRLYRERPLGEFSKESQ